ncbi:hypothetical protein [Sphaerisporangium dianthi]|uniref:SHOCT domain-containing protein n=1 Tax=Sphaerisporangium dianthi TaxID=1436120 RepID=A0ABV9CJJ4_9ACTN
MQMYLYGFALSNSELLLTGLGVVLFCATIIAGVKVVLHDPSSDMLPGALSYEEDALFRKFADGEIDDDEYRLHREALRGSPPSAAARGASARLEDASTR